MSLGMIYKDGGCILGQSKKRKLNLQFCDRQNTSIFCFLWLKILLVDNYYDYDYYYCCYYWYFSKNNGDMTCT